MHPGKWFKQKFGARKPAKAADKALSTEYNKTNSTSSAAIEDPEPPLLWKAALDKLVEKSETRKLVEVYINDLLQQTSYVSDQLIKECAYPDTHNEAMHDGTAPISNGLTDPNTFQQLSVIVHEKLLKIPAERLGEKVIMKRRILKIIHFILFAKETVGSVLNAVPQAALAWAGVVFVLSVLQNPLTKAEEAIDGLSYISRLLIRCAVIEDTYLKNSRSTHSQSSPEFHLQELKRDFTTETVRLYAQILEYQIRLVKYLDRSAFCRFFVDLAVTDDWKTMLTNVEETEGKIDVVLKICDKNTLKKIQDGLCHLEGQVEQMLEPLTKINERMDRVEQDRQLGKLRSAEGAAFNHKKNQHKRCLENTRVDLLMKIREWATDPHGKDIFWMNGRAGTGKSTIARTVAYHLAEQGCLGASFFFVRGEGDRSHTGLFFTSLAIQLVELHPSFKPYICTAIMDQPTIADGDAERQWTHLFTNPLSKVEGVPRVLILVIDALDECESDADIQEILTIMTREMDLGSVRLRLFLTSRPERSVRLPFYNIDKAVLYDLELHSIPQEVIEHDIRVYLTYNLGGIQKKYKLPERWPGDQSISVLAHRAGRLFIYAATVCRFVDNSGFPKKCLDDVLKADSPRGSSKGELDEMYTKILQQCLTNNSDLIRCFRIVVGTIVILFDPLSAKDLATLRDMQSYEVNGILVLLHSVLDISEDEDAPIQLFHESFRDFLTDQEKCTNTSFWIDKENAHSNLFNSCIEIMSVTLKKDVCELDKPDCLVNDIDQNLISEKLPRHAQYACRYWIRHLLQSDIRLHHKKTLDFLRKHFLHWLEALSLMRRLQDGVLQIQALIIKLTSIEQLELYKLVNDARLFLLSYKSMLERAPLQAYHSAMVFSPARSVIREDFLQSSDADDSTSKWIKILPKAEDWDLSLQLCKQKLEGHTDRVRAVAFSNDGMLASGSRDHTVRLWDPRTGECKQKLEGSILGLKNLQLRLSSLSNPQSQLYSLNSTGEWVMRNNCCILYLPSNHRPVTSTVKNNVLAIGTRSGRVYFLEFSK